MNSLSMLDTWTSLFFADVWCSDFSFSFRLFCLFVGFSAFCCSYYFFKRARVCRSRAICLHAIDLGKSPSIARYGSISTLEETSSWFYVMVFNAKLVTVPNSSASRYEYSLIITSHCHLSECKITVNFCI